ncbi:dihydrolipoyl dehydrogenase family protein [Leifsonia shinshuensis]|uniref:NAD(P)/FAD-dependent oxidoreductase n=1 Tax=Leifsonia shinshuensis TaxID=150026 RepID=A0A7G6Y8N0_9MICO|nr:NAD(P)/FAD-dependent oxidoreductase [Leifsonia shinshuensis]QNE34845.1 NAD(P)/FAD-dependent oxidoreductase [Leifsonia shinshuensis]
MPATTEYDVIVIGAGAVGENVADRAAQGGMRTVIVEAELVGGECSYWACIPSKTLLRSSAALRAAQRVGGAREAVTGPLDVAAVLRRRDYMTSDWKDDGQVKWLEGAGIDLVRGWATISGPREVTVTDEDGGTVVLTAKHAVAVCTGSAALLPDIPGLRESEPWTSRDATSVQRVPVSLAILGGGTVGTEMATAYAGFGTEVHLIARHGLLGSEEPFAGERVTAALKELGVTMHLDVTTESVERTEDDRFRIRLGDGSTVETDELLVATGRLPRTSGLGLQSFGLEDGGWLTVDDSMRVLDAAGEPVGGGWLYAAGDVNHRALLTHQGKYQARAAGDAIAARAKGHEVSLAPWGAFVATADHQAVPQVTFTEPEVASVGLTAAAADKAGYRTRVVDYPIGSVSGAYVLADDYDGMARMIVDEDRGVVLGATFVGQDIGELLHSATVAIVGEVPLDRLWHAVPSYPTVSEVWLRLLETYGRPEK